MKLSLLKNAIVSSLYLHFIRSHIFKNREVFLVEVNAFASRLSC
jgi:hypothetical protein